MYSATAPEGSRQAAFHPVIGVPRFEVFNIDNNPALLPGSARTSVPPSGVARMQL